MISNEVTEWIYNVYRHRITEWNHFIMSPDHLQTYSEAIHDKTFSALLMEQFAPYQDQESIRELFITDTNEFTLLNSNQRPYKMGWSAICLDQWVRFISKYALSIEVFYHSCFCEQKFKAKRFLLCKDCLRVIFSENRESEDTHEKSIFLLFRQNIPLSELIQGNIV